MKFRVTFAVKNGDGELDITRTKIEANSADEARERVLHALDLPVVSIKVAEIPEDKTKFVGVRIDISDLAKIKGPVGTFIKKLIKEHFKGR